MEKEENLNQDDNTKQSTEDNSNNEKLSKENQTNINKEETRAETNPEEKVKELELKNQELADENQKLRGRASSYRSEIVNLRNFTNFSVQKRKCDTTDSNPRFLFSCLVRYK